MWRRALAANPFFALNSMEYKRSDAYAFAIDAMLLWAACLTPSSLHPGSWGLCQPAPFIEKLIDFEKIKYIKPHLYLNAYNATEEIIDNFSKEEITPEHFHALLAFPFLYGPFKLNGSLYYEGAVVDCLNFGGLA